MGLLDSIKNRYREEVQRFVGRTSDQPATRSSTSERRTRPHDLLEDDEIVLHVVGESAYQDELTRLRGTQQPFRQAWASLVAEPTNPHDPNAVAVTIDGERIGYLCREDGELLQPSVIGLADNEGENPSVKAAILGGGDYRLGVQVIFDPRRFNVEQSQLTMIDPRGFGPDSPRLRLREARRQAKKARSVGDRHFAYLALEDALYRLRDEPGNLDEFEAVCERHHAAMGRIVPALIDEFDRLPLLKHYKQMAIAKDKAKDYEAALSWCLRGIEVYQSAPHDDRHVQDLKKRIERLRTRLAKER